MSDDCWAHTARERPGVASNGVGLLTCCCGARRQVPAQIAWHGEVWARPSGHKV